MPIDMPDGVASADVQRQLDEMRVRLLSGRGPGASSLEVLQHTRARTRIGGEPVSQLRQRVAFQAGSARGDADVMALRVAEDRARLVCSVQATIGRDRPAASGRLGTLVAVLVGVLLRARGSVRRS